MCAKKKPVGPIPHRGGSGRQGESKPLVGLRRSQFVLGKFAVREMRHSLLAQPSLGVGPRLNFALHEEPNEVIAKPFTSKPAS